MRTRMDDLITWKFEEIEGEECPLCTQDDAWVFEEAEPESDGTTLDVLLLCTNCGHRVKIQIRFRPS